MTLKQTQFPFRWPLPRLVSASNWLSLQVDPILPSQKEGFHGAERPAQTPLSDINTGYLCFLC